MRKILAVLLSVLLLFSLVACGGNGDSESGSAPTSSESEQLSSPEDSGISEEPDVSEGPDSSEKSDTLTTVGKSTTTRKPNKTTTTRRINTTKTVKTTGTDKTTIETKTTMITSTTEANTTTTNPAVPEERTVLCWGDSLTDGMGMANYSGNKYPDALQSLLGDGYKVRNGGYSGDKSIAIMSRQGAYTLTTKEDITFAAGEATVTLGLRKEGFGFLLDDGTELTGMNVQIGSGGGNRSNNYMLLNPITIGGESYKLGYSFGDLPKPYKNGHYYVTLTRFGATQAKTIPAGSKVVLGNSDMSEKSYCEIILMGANDGLGSSEADTKLLISRYQKMIDHMKHDRYIVIIPYWASGAHTKLFKQTFGDKAISLFDEITEETMKSVGVSPTAKDLQMLKQKTIPRSLQYSTYDGLHLNEYGYKLIAKFVHERGQALGYWK